MPEPTYYKVVAQNRVGLKVHIGTEGKKTLCGNQHANPIIKYKKMYKVTDVDKFLSSDLSVCDRCRECVVQR